MKAYRALPRTRPDTFQPRPWLYRIATNTARSAVRLASWKRTFHIDRPDDREIAKNASDSGFEARYAEAELVERALAAIKPDYAAPLLLHWREGFSIDEVCEILGISRDSLKKRLYRAKKAFAEAYDRENAQSEEKEGWKP